MFSSQMSSVPECSSSVHAGSPQNAGDGRAGFISPSHRHVIHFQAIGKILIKTFHCSSVGLVFLLTLGFLFEYPCRIQICTTK